MLQWCLLLFIFRGVFLEVAPGNLEHSKGGTRSHSRGQPCESSATGLNPDKLQINPENSAYLRDSVVQSVYDSVLFM